MKRFFILLLIPFILHAIPHATEPFSVPGRPVPFPYEGYSASFFPADENGLLADEPSWSVQFKQRDGYLLKEVNNGDDDLKKTLFYYDENGNLLREEILDSQDMIKEKREYEYRNFSLYSVKRFGTSKNLLGEDFFEGAGSSSVAVRHLRSGRRSGSEVFRFDSGGFLIQHDEFVYSGGSWFGSEGDTLKARTSYNYDMSGLLLSRLTHNYEENSIFREDYFYDDPDEITVKRYELKSGGAQRREVFLGVERISAPESTRPVSTEVETPPPSMDTQPQAEETKDAKPQPESES